MHLSEYCYSFCGKNIIALFGEEINRKRKFLTKGVLYRFLINPKKSLNRYAQYDFLLSPDFSLYADMPLWKQIESVAKNRWVGAFWQSEGLKVIPTISWSTARSFEFCFDGVEAGSSVAVGMIGCKKNRLGFMRGYAAMLELKSHLLQNY